MSYNNVLRFWVGVVVSEDDTDTREKIARYKEAVSNSIIAGVLAGKVIAKLYFNGTQTPTLYKKETEDYEYMVYNYIRKLDWIDQDKTIFGKVIKEVSYLDEGQIDTENSRIIVDCALSKDLVKTRGVISTVMEIYKIDLPTYFGVIQERVST